jgi:DNA replication protein DnaC
VIVADSYSDLEDDTYAMRGVVIQGGPGVGKTTGLTLAARRLSLDGGEVDVLKFFTFPTLITALLDPVRRDSTLEACCESDDLLIDDLGSSYLRRDGMARGLIEQVFVHREAHDYPMLCSTNLRPGQFRELFGDRVYDRLRGEWGAWVNVDGPSLRRKPGHRA